MGCHLRGTDGTGMGFCGLLWNSQLATQAGPVRVDPRANSVVQHSPSCHGKCRIDPFAAPLPQDLIQGAPRCRDRQLLVSGPRSLSDVFLWLSFASAYCVRKSRLQTRAKPGRSFEDRVPWVWPRTTRNCRTSGQYPKTTARTSAGYATYRAKAGRHRSCGTTAYS